MTTTDLATRNGAADLAPRFYMSLDDLKQQVRDLAVFKAEIMDDGTDYAIIPGTPKASLLKPGAEKLCQVFGLATDFRTITKVEDWDRPLFHYEVECRLTSRRTGDVVGNGLGSANSMEGRYHWRQAQRSCPECGATAIIKGRAEYGGGWLCFKKSGGCGAKFAASDPVILSQETGRVENDDIFTLVNTLLKMAQKRALVAATLVATAASGIFTQDVEDLDLGPRDGQAPHRTHDQPDVVEGQAREVPAERPAPAVKPEPRGHAPARAYEDVFEDPADAPSPKSGPDRGAGGRTAGGDAAVDAAGAGGVAGGGDPPALPDLTAALRPAEGGGEEFSCLDCHQTFAAVRTRDGVKPARLWLEFAAEQGVQRALCPACASAARRAAKAA